MVLWSEFVRAEPEFAGRVRAVLDGHEVKVRATIRADGSPRVSGLELDFSSASCASARCRAR